MKNTFYLLAISIVFAFCIASCEKGNTPEPNVNNNDTANTTNNNQDEVVDNFSGVYKLDLVADSVANNGAWTYPQQWELYGMSYGPYTGEMTIEKNSDGEYTLKALLRAVVDGQEDAPLVDWYDTKGKVNAQGELVLEPSTIMKNNMEYSYTYGSIKPNQPLVFSSMEFFSSMYGDSQYAYTNTATKK